jgi:hypothetical protein
MLWMKAWLETRWRLAYAIGIALFGLGARYYQGHIFSAAVAQGVIGALGTICLIAACFLAGSGVKTQATLSQSAGLQGSVHFTLSLPVTRLRLLAVRAWVGLFESWGVVALVACGAWSLFPGVRGNSTAGDLGMFLVAAFVFVTVCHCVAVLFSTLLDEPWPTWTSVVMLMALLWLSGHVPVPPAINIFRTWGPDSPLITHRLPWSQVAVCGALAAALFFASFRVVETREY